MARSLHASASLDSIETLRRGAPVSAVDDVVKRGLLTPAEIAELVLPRKTLAHRRALGALTPDQTDRLARVVDVIEAASKAFDSAEAAAKWLRRPNRNFDQATPLSMLDTHIGAKAVITLLGRLEHGVFA